MSAILRDMTILTIGHSNRTFDEFIHLLQAHEVAAIAYIRSFPSSRKFPHFNKQNFEDELPSHELEYLWIPKLGGRRRAVKGRESLNTALTSPAFRSYADYMATQEFREGIDELLTLSTRLKVAYMCAEALYWRCHRRLVSDYLCSIGVEVIHIMGPKNTVPHKLSAEAVLTSEGTLIYPSPTVA